MTCSCVCAILDTAFCAATASSPSRLVSASRMNRILPRRKRRPTGPQPCRRSSRRSVHCSVLASRPRIWRGMSLRSTRCSLSRATRASLTGSLRPARTISAVKSGRYWRAIRVSEQRPIGDCGASVAGCTKWTSRPSSWVRLRASTRLVVCRVSVVYAKLAAVAAISTRRPP